MSEVSDATDRRSMRGRGLHMHRRKQFHCCGKSVTLNLHVARFLDYTRLTSNNARNDAMPSDLALNNTAHVSNVHPLHRSYTSDTSAPQWQN